MMGRALATGRPRSRSSSSASRSGRGSSGASTSQRFLLPAPSEILSTFWDERDTLVSAGLFTFKEAVGGFLIGSAFAVLVALVLARWRPLGNALMPYRDRGERGADHRLRADHEQLVRDPLAGLEDGDRSRDRLLPGDREHAARADPVRPASIELMRSYAARELEIFRRVRIPTALPYLFTG